MKDCVDINARIFLVHAGRHQINVFPLGECQLVGKGALIGHDPAGRDPLRSQFGIKLVPPFQMFVDFRLAQDTLF